MSKKPDTAAALAGILKARRGDQETAVTAPEAPPSAAEPKSIAIPSPAPLPAVAIEKPPEASRKARNGKSSDPNCSQFSVYLRKDTRKKVGRALDDDDNGEDFSDLVQRLLEQWLASRT